MNFGLQPQAMSLRWHQEKYAQPGELLPDDTQRRVAIALAGVEPLAHRAAWARRFESAMRNGLLPGGRVMAGAGVQAAHDPGALSTGMGSAQPVLMNCFVLPAQNLARLWPELRATLTAGGGVGMDLSEWPHGVLQALDQCEAVARSIEQPPRSFRRAAQMAVLRADHPDIDAFIRAPASAHPHITRAVLVREEQMNAHLMALIARGAWDSGEPGLLFADRMQADDNLGDQETLCATNPCGEQPLPAYGACALASIDLTRVVQQPFSPQAHVAWGLVASLAHVGVRLLDNALDISHWPLPQQAHEMRRHRRIGLGITGLGDALALLNLHYASPEARRQATALMRFISHAAYRASVRLAHERGAYPAFDAAHVLQAPRFASRLPVDLKHDIRRYGLRHSHLLAIAPAASISVAFADNVSNGVEPMPAAQWQRHWQDPQGRAHSAWVQGHAFRLWQALKGPRKHPEQGWAWWPLVSPEHQVAMVAALAPHVDGAISKTVSVPEDSTPHAIEALMRSAGKQGLKGLTVFRRGSRPGVMSGA